MTRKAAQLSAMFVKIQRSRALFESLGGEAALQRMTQCMDMIRVEVRNQGGKEIKTITGDTVMCTFPAADAATKAAMGIQERADMGEGGEGLAVAIGYAQGAVLLEEGDVYGNTVNVAARLASEAKGGQILTNGETAATLSGSLRSAARLVDHLPVKGISEPIDVHEVVWEEEGVTRLASQPLRVKAKEVRLHLRCAGQELTLDQTSNPITLGRGTQADLKVPEADASRAHSRIEHRRGKFVITDDSVNNTFVETSQGVVQLRRGESVTLAGSGQISLGKPIETASACVSFEATED